MKKIDLTQNTEAWLKWRREGVGASDVACLLGLNPFKTRKEFLSQWMGVSEYHNYSPSFDIERGHRLEGPAREKLCRELSVPFVPQCGEWEHDNFFRASLDGHSASHNVICEIKAPRTFRGRSDAHYYQIQAQLLVSGAKECVYCQVVERDGEPQLKWEIVKPNAMAEKKIREAVSDFRDEVGLSKYLHFGSGDHFVSQGSTRSPCDPRG